jgi:hypothetical protein
MLKPYKDFGATKLLLEFPTKMALRVWRGTLVRPPPGIGAFRYWLRLMSGSHRLL